MHQIVAVRSIHVSLHISHSFIIPKGLFWMCVKLHGHSNMLNIFNQCLFKYLDESIVKLYIGHSKTILEILLTIILQSPPKLEHANRLTLYVSGYLHFLLFRRSARISRGVLFPFPLLREWIRCRYNDSRYDYPRLKRVHVTRRTL